MTKSLMAVAVSAVTLLVVCAGAGAKEFTVQTCTTDDRHAPLGPTIEGPNPPSGWEVAWSGAAWATTNDRCVVGDPFTFQIHPGPVMAPGDGTWARWTAAPGTLLVRLAAMWTAVSDLRPDRGHGTAQLIAGTDRQTLLAQNTPFSVAFGVEKAPPFVSSVLPARWFELRFTCVDRCVTDAVEALYAYVLSARFTSTTPRRRSAVS